MGLTLGSLVGTIPEICCDKVEICCDKVKICCDKVSDLVTRVTAGLLRQTFGHASAGSGDPRRAAKPTPSTMCCDKVSDLVTRVTAGLHLSFGQGNLILINAEFGWRPSVIPRRGLETHAEPRDPRRARCVVARSLTLSPG